MTYLSSLSFDRGVVANVLEFLGVHGFAVDYFTLFELPTPPQPSTRWSGGGSSAPIGANKYSPADTEAPPTSDAPGQNYSEGSEAELHSVGLQQMVRRRGGEDEAPQRTVTRHKASLRASYSGGVDVVDVA